MDIVILRSIVEKVVIIFQYKGSGIMGKPKYRKIEEEIKKLDKEVSEYNVKMKERREILLIRYKEAVRKHELP